MPITLSCPCGKTLRVGDKYAGKRVQCPGCAALLTAQEPKPAFEVVDEPEPPTKPALDEDEPAGSYKVELAAETPDEDDDYDPYEDEDEQKKKREDKERAKEKARKKRRSVSTDSRPTVLRPEEDDEEESRPRRRPQRREVVSARAEVRRLGEVAGARASEERRRRAQREAMFRIAYLIGGLIMTLAGIGVAVFGATDHGQNATLTIIVGAVVGLCGLVALLQRFTGLLPDE